jgi:hypothetical protein
VYSLAARDGCKGSGAKTRLPDSPASEVDGLVRWSCLKGFPNLMSLCLLVPFLLSSFVSRIYVLGNVWVFTLLAAQCLLSPIVLGLKLPDVI